MTFGVPTRLSQSESTDVDELHREHAALETRLDELEQQRSLSPEEQYEKSIIKKRKLAIKDRIQELS
ncbi:MAG: YdcH family protein [Myxococcota bacterium]